MIQFFWWLAPWKLVFTEAPDGPPLDMQLEALTSHSIKVTWKVKLQLWNLILEAFISITIHLSYTAINSSFINAK